MMPRRRGKSSVASVQSRTLSWMRKQKSYYALIGNSRLSHLTRQTVMLLWRILPALLAFPAVFATSDAHSRLVELSKASDGPLRLDDKLFNLMTAPDRTWSASIQFTAMDKRRRCSPCR